MKKKNILLVDDELIILKTLGRDLREKGYEITTAINGKEAIALLKKGCFDIIVTDLVMEGINGIQVLSKAKELDPDMPVLIITGYGALQSAIDALRLGADEYLLKPCDIGELLHRISSCLETHRLRQDNKKHVVDLEEMNKKLKAEISKRRLAEKKLKQYSEQLEEMVKERTKDLQDTQEKLVRKEKLAVLGTLSSGVGHELRNPLSVISNAIYYLKMILPDSDKNVKEYMDMISSEIYNANKIVSDLLDFPNVKQPEKKEFVVSELISQVLAKQSTPEGINIFTDITSNLSSVYADPRQIGQVLTNLVTNACQTMPEGGRLTLKAENRSDKVRISISDTGCGISSKDIKKIFEPLFTTKDRGIGLGLPITKNILEQNGGSIEVKSEEGKGSTFTMTLPANKT